MLLILFPSVKASALSVEDQQSLDGDSIYYDPTQTNCGGSSTAGSVTLTGSDNEQEAYNFFIQNGLNATQASAVVGNIMDESGADPTEMQIGGNSDDPASAGSEGWGIVQWTPGSKVIQIAQAYEVTALIYLLSTQLVIVWDEMKGQSPVGVNNMLANLEQINNLSQATTYFQTNFEGGVAGQRQQDALQVYNQYGSSSGNSGTAVQTSNDSNCSSGAINCNTSSTSSSNQTSSAPSSQATSTTYSQLSLIRQAVVCEAEQQLQIWQSQPGYNTTNFPYAANGYLVYSGGIYEEWCADFVSWIYDQANDPLMSGGNWRQAGVSEIQSIGEQNQSFTWHPAGSNYIPQPGDLAVHDIDGQLDGHVNIFISSSGGVSTYIGGDQGNGPYGAPKPTTTPPSTPSESVVSTQTLSGYWGGGSDIITGYVSPN